MLSKLCKIKLCFQIAVLSVQVIADHNKDGELFVCLNQSYSFALNGHVYGLMHINWDDFTYRPRISYNIILLYLFK